MAAPGPSPEWSDVLSRERAATTDQEFADRLGSLLGVPGPAGTAGPDMDLATDRYPSPWDVERALYASLLTPVGQRLFGPVLAVLETTVAAAPPLERLVHEVFSADWQERWVSRHCLEKATEGLHGLLEITDTPDWEHGPMSYRLIAMVVSQTGAWVGGRLPELLCRECYVRCALHTVRIRYGEISYYACRRCRRAWRMLVWPKRVVALLDDRAPGGHAFVGEELWVNWLPGARARGFEGQDVPDFDRVEIRSATDDDIRHFAADIAGEPDRAAARRQRAATCVIAGDLTLGRNSLNILRSLFRSVRVARG